MQTGRTVKKAWYWKKKSNLRLKLLLLLLLVSLLLLLLLVAHIIFHNHGEYMAYDGYIQFHYKIFAYLHTFYRWNLFSMNSQRNRHHSHSSSISSTHIWLVEKEKVKTQTHTEKQSINMKVEAIENMKLMSVVIVALFFCYFSLSSFSLLHDTRLWNGCVDEVLSTYLHDMHSRMILRWSSTYHRSHKDSRCISSSIRRNHTEKIHHRKKSGKGRKREWKHI